MESVVAVERHAHPPPQRESARQSMDEATTHGDEPLATLLHCEVEVQALLSTLADPVTTNDELLVVVCTTIGEACVVSEWT